jgi:D-glycero-alpha-D-manno-heptose-7-phosphate kinase
VTTIAATAPVRVCDAGGWTDTWFARRGVVCSVAVEPGAQVQLTLDDEPGPVVLDVAAPGPHPLLEAAIAQWPVPEGRGARITVGAAVPPGSGLGTSAAVVVALLTALRAAHDEPLDPIVLARDAHGVETGLGLQSGVQDQYAAACGGCNVIRVDAYPTAVVEPIALPDATRAQLDARLVTVYLGRPHESSPVHETVIAHLEGDPTAEDRLEPLRAAALDAAAALAAGEVERYGAALAANTDAQAALHPALVSTDARALIELARAHDAAGWKVNGAGGDGGTVTIVASADPARRATMLDAIDAAGWLRLPLQLASRGCASRSV